MDRGTFIAHTRSRKKEVPGNLLFYDNRYGCDAIPCFLAGGDDFILHVAARDTEDLRSFVVENLNADADVAGTQTSLIYEHLRGASPL